MPHDRAGRGRKSVRVQETHSKRNIQRKVVAETKIRRTRTTEPSVSANIAKEKFGWAF